ncbi:MAG TPA: hypothetical protein VFY51_01675 [Pyrinomonadaceae bacterium]|nr:hypothetical protein [Pyrinomonadaceae bacterium]
MREFIENPVELRTSVTSPHFDDRRVAMRAQPVVPLDEIRTKLRNQRLWFLSGAFAIAMMLGAASALLAVLVKRSTANTTVSQVAEPETTTTVATQLPPVDQPQIIDSGEQIADSATVEETPVEPPVRPATATPKRPEPLASRPRIVNRNPDPRSVQPTEEEQLEQIREAVLYEQWQERRARRAARRERRNRAYDRDLSHLDEIFEGQRRRPERPY